MNGRGRLRRKRLTEAGHRESTPLSGLWLFVGSPAAARRPDRGEDGSRIGCMSTKVNVEKANRKDAKAQRIAKTMARTEAAILLLGELTDYRIALRYFASLRLCGRGLPFFGMKEPV